MRDIRKTCAHCGSAFKATCGVEKYCSDRCKFQLSYAVRPSGCWEWTREQDKDGYGRIKEKVTRLSKRAHRYSYEMHVGRISDDVMVCHSCDNPSCVNPKHLFLGGAQDNKDDSVAKARHVHGLGVYWKRKLTEAQVIAIRADTRRPPIIAAEYGVTKENIYAIRDRKIWKHLP